MEWIERLNGAIGYIEEHIADEIEYEKLGRIACCSGYHFQRMFAYMAGIPLSEYIRRRRMSLAAVDLQNGEKSIDVGLRYGYNSPTAFNRAFQGVHGVTPREAKKGGVCLKSFPPISFKITIKGVKEMNYRIEKKEEFRIVGISMPLDKQIEKNYEAVPSMWQKASTDGTIAKLCGLMKTQPMGVLGVSSCNNNDEQWKYFIAVASSAPLQNGLEEYLVPAATWAIFSGAGNNLSIQQLEQRIVTEWLPTSGYEYGDAPDVEVYLNPDPNDAKYEVWIPVRKANG